MFANLAETFFSFEGRIGRWSYFARHLLLALGGVLFLLALTLLCFFIGKATHSAAAGLLFLIPAGAVWIIASVWGSVALAARRYHDFGWSGKWQFVNLGIFIFGATFALYCLAAGGIAEIMRLANGHGGDPGSFQQAMKALPFYRLGGALSTIGNLVSIAMQLHLLFRPGNPSDNAYGGPGGGAAPRTPRPDPVSRPGVSPSPGRGPIPQPAAFASQRATFGQRR